MANVYSILMWSSGPTIGGGVYGYNPTPVPLGFVWDVRSVSAMCCAANALPLRGITWGDSHHGLIAAIGAAEAYPNVFYPIETRQIIEPGDRMSVITDDAGWYFRVCGYQLALP